ncbi:MAG TPA: alanine--tRNA ligase [Tissierellaceae bacterium]|nr:alanine--tRNA ligase [Tissierellaceae bacterium]
MRQLGLHEIRKEFLDYFREKEHLVVPSFSLIPKNDKSLLLIGAGMAPIKKYFTGEALPPSKRMSTCQKCIRTGDIDNVGKTDRHATFFEMLGNFSFGDYFKKEAIEWAWEFLTERLEISEDVLWASIYEDDDEAFELWNKDIGLAEDKIVRLGKEDNFWELEVGPSGPCSEIYIDRGIEYGCGDKDCKPGCECDRFLEVWNLVFTQFDKDENGVYHPLAHPNIDTGMGLERIATILEGADNIFEVKEIQKIINKIESISSYKYGTDDEKDVSVRVITDHSRAMTFLVSDGVLPSNEGRGYVLRRLIRRAARHGKLLGIDGEFLNDIINLVIESWKVEYKELEDRKEQINKIVKAEEDKFQETIDQGIAILESYIDQMLDDKEDVLSGEKAFRLYDTFGFPLDLTKEILEEKALSLDEEEFNKKMEEQKERARNARVDGTNGSGWKDNDRLEIFKELESEFKGYEFTKYTSEITSLISENNEVEELIKDQEGLIILDETPFYGESGGQVGDTGFIENDDFKAEVTDTQHINDSIVHHVKILEGKAKINACVSAKVDEKRRDALRRNHSATHLLHKALKEVLGDHVNQAGSIVLPNRLRFDFTHFEAPSKEDLLEIEKSVNEKVLAAMEVKTSIQSISQAQENGAVGLFEDKYGDEVRIISMGDYSMELCGGTHVNNTSNIGLFKILSEGGVASGVRRIEAITGFSVYEYLNQLDNELDEISHSLKTNRNNILEKAHSLTDEIKLKDKEIESLKSKLASDISQDIIDSAIDVEGLKTVVYKVDKMDMDSLRNLGDEVRDKIKSGIVVLASLNDDKVTFLAMATKDAIAKGISAGNVVREVAKLTGGNGGGRPDMAQAGGKDITKVDEALSIVPELVKNQIK